MAYPETITTIADHVAAGPEVTSHCSTGKHRHVIDLQALIGKYGPDRELDYTFAVEQRCPQCGAPGGGLAVSQRSTSRA